MNFRRDEKIVGILRIAFALLMLFRYLQLLPTAPLFSENILFWPLLYVMSYALLAVGFMTPLVLILVFFLEVTNPIYIAVKIHALIPFVLFFMRSGSCYSLDSILSKSNAILEKILAWPMTDIHRHSKDRFAYFFPFGVLSLLAAISHLQDENWVTFEIVRIFIEDEQYLQIPQLVRSFLSQNQIAKSILTILLGVQLIWELLMIPLFFNKTTRWFVILYGYSFFLFSALFLNLSFLPYMEVIYWTLIFYPEFLGLKKEKE